MASIDDTSNDKTRLYAAYREDSKPNYQLDKPFPIICWEIAVDQIYTDEHSKLVGHCFQTPKQVSIRY